MELHSLRQKNELLLYVNLSITNVGEFKLEKNTIIKI